MKIYHFILVGFIAQLIDGTLGMAYGVCATSILNATGMPIKIASASVHISEIFTTLVSGISHFKAKNIDWFIFSHLVISGMIGGLLGTILLAFFLNELIQPIINIYLLIIGVRIINRAFKNKKVKKIKNKKQLLTVGFGAGCLDALGGGGWGPIVTSTMIVEGYSPRYIIGSLNAAEFFVTLVQSLSFICFIEVEEYLYIIMGLMIGGCIAAPISAYLCRRISERRIMLIVGVLIILLNLNVVLRLFK